MASKGHIYVDYFIDCGICGRETPVVPVRMRATQEARRMGYTYTRKHGWVCPKCQKAKQQPTA